MLIERQLPAKHSPKPLENSKFRRHWHFLAITRAMAANLSLNWTVVTQKHARTGGQSTNCQSTHEWIQQSAKTVPHVV